MLTGSVGTVGGTSPNGWNKFIPIPPRHAPPQARWNDLTWPIEYPLAHHEMSFLLPYFLKSGRGRIDTYFTRVYNPVWTNPDGFSWIEVLTDTDLIGCHVALTPTWSETAWFADYVLPMGLGAERHDVASYETHSGRWIGFRQPVRRRYADLAGQPVHRTHEANPGEVWEENEFWIDLSWKIDPDGDLGIRAHFESIERPGEPMGIDEYYEHLFTHSIPGLPDAAAAEGVSPLEYMRRRGAFAIPGDQHEVHERTVTDDELTGAVRDDAGVYRVPATAGRHHDLTEITGHMPFIGDGSLGVDVDGTARVGFPTPSRKLELYSPTLADWGWPEWATPTWIRSHVHWEDLDLDGAERILVPTFRLPTLIHTRSGNAKWLNEISHRHPLWIHPSDAEQLGVESGGLCRVATRTGYFAIETWRTEGIRPGVVACSHHMGRWRLDERRRQRAVVVGARRTRPERSWLGLAPASRHPGVPERRPRFGPDLVDRRRGAPEPHVPTPTGSCLRHALLVAARHHHTCSTGRPPRRRPRRHRRIDGRLRGVAAPDTARARSGQPAAPAVVRPPRQTGRDRLWPPTPVNVVQAADAGGEQMEVVTIETPPLGDRSYLIHDGRVAMVVDPQRDIDRILDAADAAGVTITHVAETHVHNDYVSGGLVLARITHASYVHAAAEPLRFDHVPVRDGDAFAVGRLRVEVVHTPGHTAHHLSYVVRSDGHPATAFTGGSLLYGTVGRTDLIAADQTEHLTRSQFRSARRLAAALDDDARLYPTHGFGSFCASAKSEGSSDGTVGAERRVNLALVVDDEDSFVERLVAGLTAYPRYYAHMGPMNLAGAVPVDLSPPAAVDPVELARQDPSRRLGRRSPPAPVVRRRPHRGDDRHRAWRSLRHLPRLAHPLGDARSPCSATRRHRSQRPSASSCGSASTARAAPRRAAPIGGVASGDHRSYPVVDFEQAASRANGSTILDVRRSDERATSYIEGSLHVELPELIDQVGRLPDQPLWVHCATGFRASIATSLLDRAGRTVVLIDDDYEHASRAGLPILTP